MIDAPLVAEDGDGSAVEVLAEAESFEDLHPLMVGEGQQGRIRQISRLQQSLEWLTSSEELFCPVNARACGTFLIHRTGSL